MSLPFEPGFVSVRWCTQTHSAMSKPSAGISASRGVGPCTPSGLIWVTWAT
jgi:hypothetical protein